MHKPIYINEIGRKFNASAGTKRDVQVQLAKLALQYPYPPKNCKEAMDTVAILDLEINGKLATNSGASKDALFELKSQFDNYISKAGCKQQIADAEDQAFYDELKKQQDQELQRQAGKKNINTGIIIAVIGILVIGMSIVIIRRRKMAQAAAK